jgi:DNA-binding transcriptional LysR family regulator
MKIEVFRTLHSVLQCGSFAAAAVDMNLSPSAVSLQMKQMEDYFGQSLFDRSALQVRPNAFAAEVDGVFTEMLARVDGLRRNRSATIAGKVRLGIIEPLQASMLPGLLRQVRARHPLLDVRPVRGRVTDLLDKLKSTEIDAAIIVQPPGGGSRRLAWTPLFREPLVLIAPPDSTEVRIADLFRNYEWIRFDKTTIGGRAAAGYVMHHAPHARSRIDLQSLAAIVALVSEGLGVSVLPDQGPSLYRAYPVRTLPLGRNGPYRQIAFACRRSNQEDRLLQALLACAQHWMARIPERSFSTERAAS